MERKLRKEIFKNDSGTINYFNKIPHLKNRHYLVQDSSLDGDAPKEFIKAYFFERDSFVRSHNANTWHSYVAKTAEKWYPHESIIEFMINRVGQVIGINMNECLIVRANGQVRFLSKYFLNKNETLIHGAEICGQHLGDMEMAKQIAHNKGTARELFTYEYIKEGIEAVFPNNSIKIIKDLVRMIAFDAIVGSNDRHFYNWGVIAETKKSKKIPSFAPLYDSSRGLLWNWSDEKIIRYLKNKSGNKNKITNYINLASPRISVEGDCEVNHFELVKKVKNENKENENIVKEIVSEENEKKIYLMLDKEFKSLFIKERFKLTKRILKLRFEKLRKL